MSLTTLQDDVRYQDARRAFAALPLDVLDPAVGLQLARGSSLISEMLKLAIEHGWVPEREDWQ